MASRCCTARRPPRPRLAPKHTERRFAVIETSVTTIAGAKHDGRRPLRWSSSRVADRTFELAVAAFAAAMVLLALLIAWELWRGSAQARHAFGFAFITSTAWDPVNRLFGAAPFIFGTVVTSLVALLLAGPIGIGAAIFLTELAPRAVRGPVGFL